MSMINRFTIAAACCLAFQANAQAQTVRCTNAAGVVVAYAESAAYCPKDGAAVAVEKSTQPTASQTAQAQKLAAGDKKQGDALEAKRLKQERAEAKSSADYSKKQATKAKNCKKTDLNIEEAKAKLEDARLNALKKGATKTKPKTKNDKPSSKVTASRADDEPNNAAYKRAKRKLALLEAKRDLDCK